MVEGHRKQENGNTFMARSMVESEEKEATNDCCEAGLVDALEGKRGAGVAKDGCKSKEDGQVFFAVYDYGRF